MLSLSTNLPHCLLCNNRRWTMRLLSAVPWTHCHRSENSHHLESLWALIIKYSRSKLKFYLYPILLKYISHLLHSDWNAFGYLFKVTLKKISNYALGQYVSRIWDIIRIEFLTNKKLFFCFFTSHALVS